MYNKIIQSDKTSELSLRELLHLIYKETKQRDLGNKFMNSQKMIYAGWVLRNICPDPESKIHSTVSFPVSCLCINLKINKNPLATALAPCLSASSLPCLSWDLTF